MNTQYLTTLPQEWENYARVFTALGDGTRQKILLLFEPGEEITLKTLVDLLPLSRTSVSYHVNLLLEAGLLRGSKRGRELYLRLETGPIHEALQSVLDYARNFDLSPSASPAE